MIFQTHLDWHQGPHILLYNEYQASFTGVKWPGHGIWPPTHQSPLVPRLSTGTVAPLLPTCICLACNIQDSPVAYFWAYFQSVMSHKHMNYYQTLETDHYLNIYNKTTTTRTMKYAPQLIITEVTINSQNHDSQPQ